MMCRSPIVLFVYNRPLHTRQTVESLQKNFLAAESDLFIFSDGVKDERGSEKVDEVRAYIRGIDGFRKVSIVERKKNWGLADNIIYGVSDVVKKYGRVIVLEDDIVTSPYFLQFMNDALDLYENEQNVWHISGYMFPIKTSGLSETFFTKGMFCWGWGTWERAWRNYRRDPEKVPSQFSKEMISDFNYDDTNAFFDQILDNISGKLHTWEIFWYVAIYLNEALCLCPRESFVKNIGHDGSGIHCGKGALYETAFSHFYPIKVHNPVIESQTGREALKNFFKSLKPSFTHRMARRINNLLFRRGKSD